MTADVQPDQARYRAFISYSHKDAGWARLLHRRLEAYRMPARLVGAQTPMGPVPARLSPIFRDRDELPAAGDLSEQVRAALARSESLIVVCSPDAAASPWVAREISLFRSLHPDRPVLSAVVGGAPGEWFPEPLIGTGADGKPTEPLAADLRKEGDGLRLGLLKLIAGVTGVALDSLVQRDAQRKLRRVTAVTVGALFGMLAMGLLAIAALNARAEAERQRAQAEGLIEFMLTDLRERLRGVGRLDVLTAVNERAIAYYGSQQRLEDLPAESLERRARILHAMGEDDQMRGDAVAALQKFREAHRTTAALLAKDPNDPDRIYAHAQSEFWVGSVDYDRREYRKAKQAWERYKALADRLLTIDPDNAEWLTEAGFAEGNLCTVALAEPIDAKAALRACTASLAHMQKAARASGGVAAMASELQNRHAWLADAYKANGDRARAWEHRRAQARLIEGLLARDSRNMDVKDMWLTLQMAMAELEAEAGLPAAARARLRAAKQAAQAMVARDPRNSRWRGRLDRIERDLSKV